MILTNFSAHLVKYIGAMATLSANQIFRRYEQVN
jgi:hypothetical protein